MLKKIIAAMLSVSSLTFALGGIPASYALIPDDAVEVGGLRPGYTMEYMESIYGSRSWRKLNRAIFRHLANTTINMGIRYLFFR